MRAWAIALLDKNSPVPFTPAARESLQKIPFNTFKGDFLDLFKQQQCEALEGKRRSGEKLTVQESWALEGCNYQKGSKEPMLVTPPGNTKDHPMVVRPPDAGR